MNARCPSCEEDLRERTGNAFIGPMRFCDDMCTLAWRYRRGQEPDRRRAGTSDRRRGERRTVERRVGSAEQRNRYGDDRRQADRRKRISA